MGGLMASDKTVTGALQGVTITLTGQFTAPGLQAKDESGRLIRPLEWTYHNEWFTENIHGDLLKEVSEFGSNVALRRYSNREFLDFMVEEGVISDISGWSIKGVLIPDSLLTYPVFYLFKNGRDPIFVNDFFFGSGEATGDGFAYYGRTIDTTSYPPNGSDSVFTRTGSGYTLTPLSFAFLSESSGVEMSAWGLYRQAWLIRPIGTGSGRLFFPMPNVGTFSNLVGDVIDLDFEDTGVLTGSLTFGVGTFIEDVEADFPEIFDF